ncbi:HlyD family secretion protein [Photobacterium damselae]|uniref:Multidrug resistance efflux pump n=2 Tax=Photobacterium damselae TaxID=38293 RepID=D0YZ38_PHODD|nr:HlyD family secretion protein [Photobacterium damselae]EEZ41519.1 multidrug resistance efflux pump [Photobacterium damselae subsp. damselae CIP 102761]PSW87249.1 HlyD family secretion protein [Photobacterium damselae]SPY27666.1 Inner membrane protein yiaV precursor [Photobacterium damselae]
MKKKVIVFIGIILATVAGYRYIESQNEESTDNAYVHADVTAISPEVGGQVMAIHVKDNQWVKQGTPLFSIDNADYEANYQISQAAVEVAQAALKNNQTRIDMQKVKIEQAKQNIASADANANHQNAELKRFARLLKPKMISENHYEAQRSTTIDANAKLKSAQLLLTSEQKLLETLHTEKQQLIAQVQQVQAKLKLNAISLQRTVIKAPFDGYIASRQVQVGKYVQPGMGVIVMVPRKVWVEANFKETQLKEISVGQIVDVVLDGYPDTVLTGKVDSITPATGAQFSLLPAQNATGNFVKVVQRVPVRIDITIPKALEHKVYPGLSAEVTVVTQS